jgi:hypothetical protein
MRAVLIPVAIKEKMKYCIECNFQGVNDNNVHICTHPNSVKICKVTGEVLYFPCKQERSNKIDAYCRPKGYGFVKRDFDSYEGP